MLAVAELGRENAAQRGPLSELTARRLWGAADTTRTRGSRRETTRTMEIEPPPRAGVDAIASAICEAGRRSRSRSEGLRTP